MGVTATKSSLRPTIALVRFSFGRILPNFILVVIIELDTSVSHEQIYNLSNIEMLETLGKLKECLTFSIPLLLNLAMRWQWACTMSFLSVGWTVGDYTLFRVLGMVLTKLMVVGDKRNCAIM
jgi:hypothetical protein